MNFFKIVVIAALMFGGYTLQQMYQEGNKHKAFVKEVEAAVERVDIDWSNEEGKDILRKKVVAAAERHAIPLVDEGLTVSYKRFLSYGKPIRTASARASPTRDRSRPR